MFALFGHPVSDTLPPPAMRQAPDALGEQRSAYLLRIAQKCKKNRHGTKKRSRGSTT